MKKDYKDKAMKSENVKNKQSFFFPKANPPITIEAETLEEALEIIENEKNG